MLVVVGIMMLLVAMAATTMQPATESRRVREAARAVNAYLSSARNRAMETGRPCGVMFRRLADQSNTLIASCSMTLEQCEVPPCYAGDTTDATVQVLSTGGFGVRLTFIPNSSFTSSIVSPGDLIQFNGQGPLYEIVGPNPLVLPINARCIANQGQLLPWPNLPGVVWDGSTTYSLGQTVLYPDTLGLAYTSLIAGNAGNNPSTSPTWTLSSQLVPYRVFRAPVKSAVAPLQLPASTVVDLDWSGTDSFTLPYNDTNAGTGVQDPMPVVIMFAPNGSVSELRYWQPYDLDLPADPLPHRIVLGPGAPPVTQPIFLLVGKRERVPTTRNDYNPMDHTTWASWGAGGLFNPLDPNNPGTWVPTGWVTADQATWPNWQDLNNLWVVINPQTGLVTTAEVAAGGNVVAARALARDLQAMGGK